jgi:hypothetical protein
MMTLNGDLGVFPLEEVLRLLARSHKTGCLQVEGSGRVYLTSGALTLATTSTDEELGDRLAAAEMTSGRRLDEFFREETVESLYRIRRPAGGQFVFNLDETPAHPSTGNFDVEPVVGEADRRAAEWADIESVLDSVDTPVQMVAEISSGDSVTISAATWRLLAAMRGSDTAANLARRLGTTNFGAAREVANLLRDGLLEVLIAARPTDHGAPVPIETGPDDQGWWVEPEPVNGEIAEEAPTTAADTPEGFLERVFSQLEEAAKEEPEHPNAGVGMLKRRRMMAVPNQDED